MAGSVLIECATAAGAAASEIPRKQAWALLQAWREIYCAPLRAATGSWGGGARGPSWHTFSAEHFPSVTGKRAWVLYADQVPCERLVLAEDDHTPSIRCVGGAPLDLGDLALDLYVAPPSFDWTMVFTHEQPWCGPYFSRRHWLDP